MFKFLSALAMLAALAGAKIEVVNVSPVEVEKYSQIIDVRTLDEWRETGVIKDAITIDIVGNKKKFAEEVLSKIDPKKPVALVCRTGRRSTYAANFLEEEFAKMGIDIHIINLNGGMKSLIEQGFVTVPYSK